MARGQTIKFLRTTRANLETQKTASGLILGEPYLITDENRIAIATAVNAYYDFALKSELHPAETTTTIGALISGATEKTTPVDADMVGLMDSAAANILKKLSWANIKATLKNYFDTLYGSMNNPMTTAGDIIYGGTSGAPTRLAKGMDTQVLTLVSGLPSWVSAASGATTLETESEIKEDFIGGNTSTGYIGKYGWKFTGAYGGTVSYTSSEAGRLGLIKVGAGTTQDKGSTLYLVDAANQPMIPDSLAGVTMTFSVRQIAADSSQIIHIGTADNVALLGDVNNGAYFRFTNSGNWYAITRSSGVETSTDTGVANSTSWRKLTISTASDYGNIKFYIDGVLKATHTTNLPRGALSPRMQVVITTATEHFLLVDYFYMKATGLIR